MQSSQKLTQFIKSLSAELGFSYCGIAKAEKLDDDARRLEQWLNKGMQGSMNYMERYFDQRIDPSLLVPGAKSVVTLLLNYFPTEQQQPTAPKVSRYAFGNDYHEVIRGKLNELLIRFRTEAGDVHGRGFVDSAPVLERSWALKSGLGWIGKNGNLITKNNGSFFFIATLIMDIPLEYDSPFTKDYCGTCTRCIDSCPTEAILPDKQINGSKCISYFTIELKDELIPSEMSGKFGDWIFGCDVCQEVCPWNRFSTPQQQNEFKPIPEILNFSTGDWEHLTEEKFRQVFRHSAIKRTKFKGIQRNLRFIKN